jgi:hypothetical protein
MKGGPATVGDATQRADPAAVAVAATAEPGESAARSAPATIFRSE